MVSWCKKGEYNAQISPKSEFLWVQMGKHSQQICIWQIRHQTHVLCGRTTFGTESN